MHAFMNMWMYAVAPFSLIHAVFNNIQLYINNFNNSMLRSFRTCICSSVSSSK
uniref:Uncharacterized protein n=1 Tax=Octopus bimaculoides TaxID=37653 RepID=A0A0L8GCD2_OCTBM